MFNTIPEETNAALADPVLPSRPMSTVPRIATTPPPLPSYRREKWILGLGLGFLSFGIAAVGGVALGGRLTHQASLPRVADGDRSAGATLLGGLTASRTIGPGIVFDPAAFPKEQFAYTPPPAEETPAETTSGDGTIIEEVGVGEPVDLLGGEATADSEGDAPGIFFGQDPPTADPSGETDLFDLGAEAPPASPADDPDTPIEPEHFTLSLGSFASRANADQLVSQLAGHGVSAAVSEQEKADGTLVFRVYGGSFDSKAAGEQKVSDLRAAGIDAWLVKG